jgi:chemotaxis signal transduction protein
MESTSVLEFKLNNEIYCFNTKNIAYVFDLEEYKELRVIDSCVLGVVYHNDNAMFLVDTLNLYNKSEKLNMDTQKSVVVFKDTQNEKGYYGLAVDEIVKIEDVEIAKEALQLSTEEVVINHYKDKDRLVNEIDPLPLLHVRKIPPLHKNKKAPQSTDTIKTTVEFLLFVIDGKKYAIESEHVKEVLERESELFEIQEDMKLFKGALSLRFEVVLVANLKSEGVGDEIIVIEEDKASFCIDVDEVIGIEEFFISKIEQLPQDESAIKALYSYKDEVVAILNKEYFIDHSRHKDTHHTEENSVMSHLSKKGFLLFGIAGKELALNMENVRQVFETEDLARTTSSLISSDSHVEFITSWNHHAVEVVKIHDALEIDADGSLLSHTVIIEDDDHKFKGILVDTMNDIEYVNDEDIVVGDTGAIIDGAVIAKEQIIPKLNPNKVIHIR